MELAIVIITLPFQMKKLKHEEVKLFAQGHTATKCENLSQESKVAKHGAWILIFPFQPNHLGKVNELLLASHLHFEHNTYLIEVLYRLKNNKAYSS